MAVRPGDKPGTATVPSGWDLQPLSRVAEIRSGIAKNGNIVVGDPIWVHYLRVANVQDGFLDLSEMSKICLSRNALQRYAVQPGDVLMNEGGDLDKLGRGCVWQGELEPCVHQNHVFVVRCGSRLSPKFLNHWTGSASARQYFMLAGKQTTNLASISKTALGNLPVLLPQPEAQRAIAQALSDVDALILGLDRLIAKKRDLKQAAMQQLLRGKRRLPGFTCKWSSLNLASISMLKARIGWQGLTTAEYLNSGTYYLVTGTDFADGRIEWKSCHFVEQSRYAQDSNIQLASGDVLLTKDGTIGKVAFLASLPGPATLNSGVFVIRPKNRDCSSRFLYYVLESTIFGDYLSKLQAGSTISHLYQKDFVGFSFLAPAFEEQEAIATALSDMDAEIAALERRRDKTRFLKQGMMQELLTGRIRLV